MMFQSKAVDTLELKDHLQKYLDLPFFKDINGFELARSKTCSFTTRMRSSSFW